jgi:hypothetical protein
VLTLPAAIVGEVDLAIMMIQSAFVVGPAECLHLLRILLTWSGQFVEAELAPRVTSIKLIIHDA